MKLTTWPESRKPVIGVEESFHIDAPVATVFGVVTDISQEPKWRDKILRARYIEPVDTPCPPAGAKAEYVSRFLGRRIESTVTFTGCEPNAYLRYEVDSGAVRIEGIDRFEAEDSGTRYMLHHQGRFTGLLRLMQPLGRLLAPRDIRSDLRALKEYIESGEYEAVDRLE